MKTYFDIQLESRLPATIKYRILAESPQEALQMLLKGTINPIEVKYKLNARRDIKATIYAAGSNLVKLVKHFIR